jgi:hypothetical protein
MEARTGKMATAKKKLAVLQNIKQEKCVLFRSFSNDLTKQKKCENWKEVTELAESLRLAFAAPNGYTKERGYW